MQKLARPEFQVLQKIRPVALRLGLTVFITLATLAGIPHSARAGATGLCADCVVNSGEHAATRIFSTTQHIATRNWIQTQFDLFRRSFFIKFFFDQNVATAMMEMTEQLITTSWLQILAFGGFMDATEQLQTQRLLQQMTARAHKDYEPDVEMCSLGTVSRSLGPSYRNSQLTAHIFSKRLQDRMLLNGESMAGGGLAKEMDSRFDLFRQTFCDQNDMFKDMKIICNNTKAATANRDIDYIELVGMPQTIPSDLGAGSLANDESAILSMATNLYDVDTFDQFIDTAFRDPGNHSTILDIREVVARHNVAEFSFDNIVGMKTSGSTASNSIGQFVNMIYQQFGLSATDAKALVGDRPSYNALMEMMNKTALELPNFYINLYTTPTNVNRIGATIRAANLMQDMDKFNSQLRMEMEMSQILEMELMRVQDQVKNRVMRIKPSGAEQSQ